MSNDKAVVLHSGGMDSTTLLYHVQQDYEPLPIAFDYGQRHNKEIDHAYNICDQEGLNLHIVDLASLRELFAGSSQTSPDIPVPEGHYAEESMKLTVVPNRNMVMLALANAYAQTQGAIAVAYAAHAGDHAIYPDCRPEFAKGLATAFAHSGWSPPDLLTPFINSTKADIVRLGDQLRVPFNLTWSCYNGREKHCGKCGTCVERIEAFQLAGVDDPTVYELTEVAG